MNVSKALDIIAANGVDATTIADVESNSVDDIIEMVVGCFTGTADALDADKIAELRDAIDYIRLVSLLA